FESLCVLYHETGDRAVLDGFEEILKKFFETYPLQVMDTSVHTGRFQLDEDRDVMSVGWLVVVLISLFYTRVPYEIHPDAAFEMIKRIWFLGIQFRRFDTDGYKAYNHHMWERGLVPFLLGTLLPEIPDFAVIKSHGAAIVCRHIKEDFNEYGGYNEHSMAYWAGAAVGEMLYRGVCIAKLNREPMLDEEATKRLTNTFHVLVQLAPPGKRYPSIGDNGGPMIDPILQLGVRMLDDPYCKELLEVRNGNKKESCSLPLDYCNQETGFVCGKSDYSDRGTYFVMSAKTNCGYSGHNHMDMLSLCVTFRGEPIFGEPYSDALYHSIKMGSDLRGYMYNMESHNSVLAYGMPILPNQVYANKWGVYRPDSPISETFSTEEGVYADAYHNAYTFCCHRRKVLFHRKKGLMICDQVERGNRLLEAHIARWHLQPQTNCKKLAEDAILIEKGRVKVLCLCLGADHIKLWKNEKLYPEIISKKEDLCDIMDISFQAPEDKRNDIMTVSLQMLMLDVSDMDLEHFLKEEHMEQLRKKMRKIEGML
ncbi:MAG: heparinase II/III family protein, partial [Hungatella sp.]